MHSLHSGFTAEGHARVVPSAAISPNLGSCGQAGRYGALSRVLAHSWGPHPYTVLESKVQDDSSRTGQRQATE